MARDVQWSLSGIEACNNFQAGFVNGALWLLSVLKRHPNLKGVSRVVTSHNSAHIPDIQARVAHLSAKLPPIARSSPPSGLRKHHYVPRKHADREGEVLHIR